MTFSSAPTPINAGRRLQGTPAPQHLWTGQGGVSIAGDAWGEPGQPLVVLLHGGGQTRHAWRGTGEMLAANGYYTLALDARGHGDSGWAPDGDYCEDRMVEDLQAVVRQVGQPVRAYIGASMGGGCALVGLGEGHLSADAVVLVDIAPRVETEGADKIRAFMMQKPEGFDSLEDVAQAIGNYQPQRQRPRSLDGLAKNVRVDAHGKYRWHWDPRFLQAMHEPGGREERWSASARALTAAAMLVRGAQSDVLSEEGVSHLRALCPQMEYVNVRDSAHMVAGDRNDAFGSAALDFLQRHVPTEIGTSAPL